MAKKKVVEENIDKPNPSLFLEVMKVYLDRMRVKKLIPIEYKNAKNEVYYDMVELIPEEQQDVFKKALADFENITDVEGWYNDTDY
jgi:hypothetical protein